MITDEKSIVDLFNSKLISHGVDLSKSMKCTRFQKVLHYNRNNHFMFLFFATVFGVSDEIKLLNENNAKGINKISGKILN